MPNNFEVLLKRGFKGEALVREWAKELGYIVLPVSLIENGGAPAIEDHITKLIVPDILAAKNGIPQWIEVKSFQRRTGNRKFNREEHGICKRHWENYRAVINNRYPGKFGNI